MKLSRNWLADYVDIRDLDAAKLGDLLTMATAEVEAVDPWGTDLGEIRIGRVLEVEKHPSADRLRVAKVDVGGEERTIVCGAPNCAAGITVPVALPGSRLPHGGPKIKVTKLRGVASEGMLCSAKELGLGEDHSGLMLLTGEVELGAPLIEAFPFDDFVIDIDNKSLTHRPDLWGHYGIAREIAGILDRELRPLPVRAIELASPDGGGADLVPVQVEDTDLCPRYLALVVEGLRIAPSPQWMQNRLTAVGSRPIHNIVDFTNYVMLEIGQPMHAFDRDRLAGGRIVVRTARSGETLTTLDGNPRELTDETLVIADAERPVALAGVMGGQDSEITDGTASMVLESANFDPISVRRTANRLALRTDAATRFEKSLDPEMALTGVLRFAKLCEELVPEARIAGSMTDAWVGAPEPTRITITHDKICRRLGCDIPTDTIERYFRSLEFGLEEAPRGWTVTVPSFRATKDIGIEEDLVEEVGRLYGYDNIEERPLRMICEPPPRDPMRELEDGLRDLLALGLGCNELELYSFVSDEATTDFAAPDLAYRELRNPIVKNLSRMRRCLVPELLRALPSNLRNFPELRLFEIGHVYHPAESGGEPREERELAIVFCRRAVGKKARRGETEFRAVQGIVEAIAKRHRVAQFALEERSEGASADGEVDVRAAAPWVHPTRTASLTASGYPVGLISQVHPAVLQKLKLEAESAIAVLRLDRWLEAPKSSHAYRPIPRFPAIFQDLAVVVEESTTVRTVEEAVRGAAGELMTESRVFDVYRGSSIPDGTKSLAFELVFQAPDRTLTDEDVGPVQVAIRSVIEERGWSIRGA